MFKNCFCLENGSLLGCCTVSLEVTIDERFSGYKPCQVTERWTNHVFCQLFKNNLWSHPQGYWVTNTLLCCTLANMQQLPCIQFQIPLLFAFDGPVFPTVPQVYISLGSVCVTLLSVKKLFKKMWSYISKRASLICIRKMLPERRFSSFVICK